MFRPSFVPARGCPVRRLRAAARLWPVGTSRIRSPPAPGPPAPGPRPPAPGPRPPASGSRPPAPGLRLPAPGSRLPAPGSRLPAPGSRLPAPGSRLPAPGPRLPAPGSRPPASGLRLPDGRCPQESVSPRPYGAHAGYARTCGPRMPRGHHGVMAQRPACPGRGGATSDEPAYTPDPRRWKALWSVSSSALCLCWTSRS